MRKVIVSGIESSGSTAVWQIASLLIGYQAAKDHGFNDPGDGFVIACYRDFRDVVSSLYRRGVLDGTPMIKKQSSIGEKLLEYTRYISGRFEELKRYRGLPNAHLLRYEDWHHDERGLALTICDLLEITRPPHVIDQVARYSALKANFRRSMDRKQHGDYDPTTRIHGRHVSQGGAIGAWKKLFDGVDAENLLLIKEILNPALKEFEYDTW